MTGVSIVIPLYNKGNYIASTLQSVVDQSLSDWEAIVVDNGSTDNGADIARQFAERDSRFRVLEEKRRGPGAARNSGLRSAGAKWVLFLDADDLLMPNHLEGLLMAARKNARAQIVAGGQREFVDGRMHQARRIAGQPRPEQLRFTSIAFAPWATGAALIRRTTLTEEFCWAEELDAYLSEDTAFWFRLLQFHEALVCENDGFLYRLDAREGRNEFQNLARWLAGLNQVYRNNLAFARRCAVRLDWRHFESLMRSYDAIWLRAREAAKDGIAEQARELAEEWLHTAFLAGGWRRPGITVRQLLGRGLRERVLPGYRRFRAELASKG